MGKHKRKTLADLKPKPSTKAELEAHQRLLDSIDVIPSGNELIGGRINRYRKRK